MKRPVLVLLLCYVLGELGILWKGPAFFLLSFGETSLFGGKAWGFFLVLLMWIVIEGAFYVLARKKILFWWMLLLPCGMFLGAYRMDVISNPENEILKDHQVTLSGRVHHVSEGEGKTVLYLYGAECEWMEEGKELKKKANIFLSLDDSQGDASWLPGSKVVIQGVCRKCLEDRNPGNFDLAEYYRTQNLDYELIKPQVLSHIPCKNPWTLGIFGLKARLKKVYEQCGGEDAGVYISMVLGDRSALPSNLKDLYQESGIGHILAISGLHISLLGMVLYRGLRKIMIPHVPSFLLCLGVIVSYGVMTGNSISTIRAITMFLIQIFARVLGLHYDLLNGLSCSGLMILLQYPRMLFSNGFWLSFLAVLGIVELGPVFLKLAGEKEENGRNSKKWGRMSPLEIVERKIRRGFLGSFAVSFITMPIVLWSYYEFPLYGVICNLVVIPCMSYLMISAILGGFLGMFWPLGGAFCLGTGHFVLKLYALVCHGLEQLPGSSLILGKPALLGILFFYLLMGGVLWLDGMRGDWLSSKNKKYLQLFAMVLALFCVTFRQMCGMECTILDVDQGDGIYLRCGTHHMMIDGGSCGINLVGEYRIIPFLKSRGVRSLDYVCITHGDWDHLSGVVELLESCEIPVKQLILPEIPLDLASPHYLEVLCLAREKGTRVEFIHRGEGFMLGRMEFTCLHPAPQKVYESENDISTVLYATYGEEDLSHGNEVLLQVDSFLENPCRKEIHLDSPGVQFLFTGDIGCKVEEEILGAMEQNETEECDGNRLGGELSSVDVYKVAHHGSRYSNSSAFLEACCPSLAVISAGVKNSYGHPHKETLERLSLLECEVLRTDLGGGITIRVP
ncbi:MAG: ComEC/Rec2 family competence protein [Lachnospiraceae bacterium]|nr:ComEC/Rec2 family competence protein [Lachnospiraceae bacterium]